MFRPAILILLTISLLPGSPIFAEDAADLDLTMLWEWQEDHRIWRLMNCIKQAPQARVRAEAWNEISNLGVLDLEIMVALKWDKNLTSQDPKTRYLASKALAESKLQTRVIAVGNLQRLIAVETDQELLWMHAVALSSIQPYKGSVLDVIRQHPFDLQLSAALNLPSPKEDKFLSQEDVAALFQQSQGPITRMEWLPDEYTKNRFAELPPVETKPADDLTPEARRLRELYALSKSSTLPNILPAPPPPEKMPAHPLIAARNFAEIINQMAGTSNEAWELFEIYAQEFPKERLAKVFIPLAFRQDSWDRERASRVLTNPKLGGDAKLAAVIAERVFKDSNIAEPIEQISQEEKPGPFAREVFRQICHHKNPEVRLAALGALARNAEFDRMIFDSLKHPEENQKYYFEAATREAFEKLHQRGQLKQPWLEDVLLKETTPVVLSPAGLVSKNVSLSEEFQRKLFQRIDLEQPARFNLILVECLLHQAAPQSKQEQKLKTLHSALLKVEAVEIHRHLIREVIALIEQGRLVKDKTNREIIQTVESLLLD